MTAPSRRPPRLSHLLLGLLLVGCSQSNATPAPTSSASGSSATADGADGADASSSPEQSGSATARAAASSAAPVDPLAPVAPIEPRERPSEEAWTAAPALNTRQNGEAPRGCAVKRLGEWVRAECKGLRGPEGSIGLGKVGTDYWTSIDMTGGWLLVRAKQGDDLAVRLWVADRPSPVLRVTWPTSSREPSDTQLDEREAAPIVRPIVSEGATDKIPPVPSEPSPRPLRADWTLATNVNTGVRSTPSCQLQVLRDWARVRCKRSIGFMGLEGCGKRGRDFDTSIDFDVEELVVHLTRGMSARATHYDEGAGLSTVSMVWPETSAQPTVLRVSSGV